MLWFAPSAVTSILAQHLGFRLDGDDTFLILPSRIRMGFAALM